MIALIIILGVLLLVVLLLLIPVDLAFDFGAGGGPTARAKWLFGLVSINLLRPPQKGGGVIGLRNIRWKNADWSTISEYIKLLNRVLRATKIKNVKGVVRFGLGNPAMTGMAYGMLQTATLFVPDLSKSGFKIEPDFTGFTLDLNVSGEARVTPLQMLVLWVGFALSPEGRQARQRRKENVRAREAKSER